MTSNSENPDQRRFRLLDLVIDLENESLTRHGSRIEVPDLSFRLLAALVARAPQQVSKDELIRAVWGDVVVSDETLAQRVRLLRQIIGEDSQKPRYLTAVRSRGYRLICDVEPVTSSPASKQRRLWQIGAVIVALAAIGVGFLAGPSDEKSAPVAANSIAVLPFADLSAASDYGYFGDGMQEELLTRLAGINELRVLSRTSVDSYRGADLDVREIAGELAVSSIIEGSVRIDGDRVRITVQLIDGASDTHLWANTYDRKLSVQDIFSIQADVASRIAEALELAFDQDGDAESVQLPTSSLEAYSAYLLGRHLTFQQTPADLQRAIEELHRATSLDPEFAEAYTALGWAYSFLGTSYGNVRPRDVYPLAKEAALKALALDSDLADARTLYADILTWYDWDFDAAEREYRKCLELDPVNVLGYALFLSSQERHEEAIASIERRLAIHPDDRYVRVNAAWRFLDAGQYERAVSEARRADGHPDARAALGFSLLALGDTEKAVAVFEEDFDLRGPLPAQLSNLAVIYFRTGRVLDAQPLLEQLEGMREESFYSPALLAMVYFAAGDPDSGFRNLQQAIDERVRDVIFLRVSGMLNNYREDPRYLALLRQAGLDT